MPQEMKYEVDNTTIEVLLKELAQGLGERLPEGWGFNLLILNYRERGSMFYISSAQRKTRINAMREFIASSRP